MKTRVNLCKCYVNVGYDCYCRSFHGYLGALGSSHPFQRVSKFQSPLVLPQQPSSSHMTRYEPCRLEVPGCLQHFENNPLPPAHRYILQIYPGWHPSSAGLPLGSSLSSCLLLISSSPGLQSLKKLPIYPAAPLRSPHSLDRHQAPPYPRPC